MAHQMDALFRNVTSGYGASTSPSAKVWTLVDRTPGDD